MGKLEELDRLDKAIKDCDIRLKSMQIALENLDKEISVLSPKALELEQNLEFHKKSETIPIAHEYKKNKAELAKTRTRLTLITSDRKKTAQACQDTEEIIAKFKRDYAKLAETGNNNVLRVMFGVRRGKK